MYTLGGGEMFGGSKVEAIEMPKDVNHGQHIIHTSGKHDSHLYVPVVPSKA